MKKLTILLVNPWIHDFAAHDSWVRPLGLLRIGRLLKNNGHDVFLLDLLNHGFIPDVEKVSQKQIKRHPTGSGSFYKEKIGKPALLEHIPRHYSRYGLPPWFAGRLLEKIPRPDAAFVTSTMTYWYPGVKETISFLRERYPEMPVILGGIYATLCEEHARKHSGADHVFSGRLIGNFDRINEIPGLEGCLGEKPALDTWVLPALELYDDLEGIPITATHGCPFHCPYCSSSLLSGKHKLRPHADVAEEVLYWNRHLGARHFVFFDDALLAEPASHFLPMADALADLSLPLTFHVPNGLYVGNIDGRVAEAMNRINMTTLRLSLETAADESPAFIGCKVSRESFVKTLGNLEEAGYEKKEIGVYLLAGLPGQDAQEVADSIRWVTKQGAMPYLALYSPIPGTRLWEESVRRSRYPLADDPIFHNNTILPCHWEKFNESHIPELKRLLAEARNDGNGC